jgi:hypothetical protein
MLPDDITASATTQATSRPTLNATAVTQGGAEVVVPEDAAARARALAINTAAG